MFSRRPKVERGISAFFVTENPLPKDHPAQSLATASLLRRNGLTGPAGRAGSVIVDGREQNEELMTPSRHGAERHSAHRTPPETIFAVVRHLCARVFFCDHHGTLLRQVEQSATGHPGWGPSASVEKIIVSLMMAVDFPHYGKSHCTVQRTREANPYSADTEWSLPGHPSGLALWGISCGPAFNRGAACAKPQLQPRWIPSRTR
jgi:hypothetical protein